MRGVYRAKISITSLAAARTLIYIQAPANAAIEILEATVTTKGSNVTNQQLEACLQRITTLGTPTATTLTPSKHEPGDQASAATAKGNVTASEPTYTADTEIDQKGFSSLGGYYHQPIPEDRMIIAPSAVVGLRLLSAPTSADFDAEIAYREIG